MEAGSSSASQPPFTADQGSSTLIAAKVKPSSEPLSKKLEDLEAIIKSGDQLEKNKIIDSLTDEVMKHLVEDCVNDVPSRGEKASSSPKKDSQDNSQPNHDVYYID